MLRKEEKESLTCRNFVIFKKCNKTSIGGKIIKEAWAVSGSCPPVLPEDSDRPSCSSGGAFCRELGGEGNKPPPTHTHTHTHVRGTYLSWGPWVLWIPSGSPPPLVFFLDTCTELAPAEPLTYPSSGHPRATPGGHWKSSHVTAEETGALQTPQYQCRWSWALNQVHLKP